MKLRHYILLFMVFLPMLLVRDFTPDNELKYLSIADEAIAGGQVFAFTNHGIPYADKPPLYIWIVMLGKLIFGHHSLFFIGLFSLLPAFVILYSMDRWVAGRIPDGMRVGMQLSLMTCVFFIGSAVVLRMDMLMCMFIVLALHTFYRMYAGQGKKRDRWMLPLYIFLALFTKGPVGILVPVLSISVFLLLKRQLKTFGKYLGWKAWLMMFSLAGLWFAGVYADGGSAYLHDLLFNQTVNRAVDSFHHKAPVWYYFTTVWYAMAPWILLYAMIFVVGIRYRLLRTDLERFFAVTVAVTFCFLSLVSAKIEIYLLPAYPFIAYLAGIWLPQVTENRWVRAAVAVVAGLFIAVLPGLFFFSDQVPSGLLLFPLLPAAVVLAGGSVMGICQLYRKQNTGNALCWISGALLAAVFTASFSLVQLNGQIGFGKMVESARKEARESGITTFSYYKVRSAENMDIYLGHPLSKVADEELPHLEQTVLFLRNRDVLNDPKVKNLVEGKTVHTFGAWSYIVLPQRH